MKLASISNPGLHHVSRSPLTYTHHSYLSRSPTLIPVTLTYPGHPHLSRTPFTYLDHPPPLLPLPPSLIPVTLTYSDHPHLFQSSQPLTYPRNSSLFQATPHLRAPLTYPVPLTYTAPSTYPGLPSLILGPHLSRLTLTYPGHPTLFRPPSLVNNHPLLFPVARTYHGYPPLILVTFQFETLTYLQER